jgi:hypothetical protein
MFPFFLFKKIPRGDKGNLQSIHGEEEDRTPDSSDVVVHVH